MRTTGEQLPVRMIAVDMDGTLLITHGERSITERTELAVQTAEHGARDFPAANVVQLRFLGPNTPSWNHGPRSVKGRGPRDTYG